MRAEERSSPCFTRLRHYGRRPATHRQETRRRLAILGAGRVTQRANTTRTHAGAAAYSGRKGPGQQQAACAVPACVPRDVDSSRPAGLCGRRSLAFRGDREA